MIARDQIAEIVPSSHPRVHVRFAVLHLDAEHGTLPEYRVRYLAHGGHVFAFTPVRLPSGEYRAYIRDQPGYGARATGAHDSHRLRDRHGWYICWAPAPDTADALMKVMRVWAECTVTYIETGAFGP